MLQDQFNPILVALEMLQNSNTSHDYETFSRLHGELEEAMETIVESSCNAALLVNFFIEYYADFNNAVSIFSGIGDNTKRMPFLKALLFIHSFILMLMFAVSREIVRKVKEGIKEFRDQIQYKSMEIPELWAKVQQYKGTFAITAKLYHGTLIRPIIWVGNK